MSWSLSSYPYESAVLGACKRAQVRRGRTASPGTSWVQRRNPEGPSVFIDNPLRRTAASCLDQLSQACAARSGFRLSWGRLDLGPHVGFVGQLRSAGREQQVQVLGKRSEVQGRRRSRRQALWRRNAPLRPRRSRSLWIQSGGHQTGRVHQGDGTVSFKRVCAGAGALLTVKGAVSP